MAKRLRCHFGRHRWVKHSDEGQPYAVCKDCKKRDWHRYPPPGFEKGRRFFWAMGGGGGGG